ncbi:MAG: hypothetical protein C0597_06945 [Marinilabiliales bacterium]|nr:MAG: hypothetical protein C0597_06945 [Marinilabiliales bacterium]
MWHGVKSFFHVIIVFQCVLFVLYLLGYKDIRKSSKWLLMLFLIMTALTELGGTLSHFLELRTILIDRAPLSLYAYYPFKLASIPLIYLYIVSLTHKDYTFKSNHLLHFIPFLTVAIYIPIKFYSLEPSIAKTLVENRTLLEGLDYDIIKFAEFFQFYIYAVLSIILIKKYRKRIKASFSTVDNIYLSWPYIVIWGLICWKTLRMTDYLLYVSIEEIDIKILYLFYIAGEIVFLIFISLLFLKGLKQPNVFFGIIEGTSKGKYEKTAIPEIQRKSYENKLTQLMEEEKPYLDPFINIKELAEKLSFQTHHLSQVINSSFNKNFFDFINSYRIEESKRLLTKYTPQEKTVLEILYDCGYNSKSVFNTAFKKQTGLTPTQYREKATMKVA